MRRLSVLDGRRGLLLCLAAYALVSVAVFDPKLYTGGDNAVYLILGRALASGQGYTNLHLPGSPAHTDYPPGFAILLAAAHLVFGPSALAAKVLVMACGLSAALLTILLFRRELGEEAMAAALFALSVPSVIAYSHWVLTEVPFLAASLGAAYCLVRWEAGSRRLLVFGLGLALVALFLRTAGVALVLGVLLFLALRRRWAVLALFGAAVAVLVGLWAWRNSQAGGGALYLNQLLARDPYVAEFGRIGLADLGTRVYTNVVRYVFTVLPWALLPLAANSILVGLLGAVLAVLAAVGFARRIKRGGIVECYAAFAGLVLLLWPQVWSTERFLVPFVPLVVVFIVVGLHWFALKLGRPWLGTIVLLAGVGLNAVSLGLSARTALRDNLTYLRGDRYSGYSLDWRRYFECIDWVRENVPEDRVVLARKPEFVYLGSGRRSFCYPFTNDRARVRAAVLAADYVLFDNFRWTETGRYFLNPVLSDEPGLFRFAHQTGPPEFFLLRVNRP